jgi:glycosyltransferase involved in cell wall biosynthesis
VPNGVDPDRFRPGLPPAWPGEPDTFTVGFVGTLKPWHGLGILIEAFANLHRDVPWARLLIVGDGPMREQIVADLGTSELLDATHLAGSIPPDEVPHWLTSLQVGVAPYPDLEGFYFSPLKVFEYMAAGLPVVASRVGQLNGVIRDGVNGILCPPGDAAALAKALRRLQADPGLRRRMGHAARESVLRHHTWDAVVTRSLQLAGIESLPPADQRGRP